MGEVKGRDGEWVCVYVSEKKKLCGRKIEGCNEMLHEAITYGFIFGGRKRTSKRFEKHTQEKKTTMIMREMTK